MPPPFPPSPPHVRDNTAPVAPTLVCTDVDAPLSIAAATCVDWHGLRCEHAVYVVVVGEGRPMHGVHTSPDHLASWIHARCGAQIPKVSLVHASRLAASGGAAPQTAR